MTDVYTRAMFGEYAVHVPMWMKVQDHGKDGVLFVGASRRPDLRYDSKRCHQLIIGEIIVRPHLVVASDAFIGSGISHLAREMDLDTWAAGEIICDPMGKGIKIMEERSARGS
jgi:hypothetical protein